VKKKQKNSSRRKTLCLALYRLDSPFFAPFAMMDDVAINTFCARSPLVVRVRLPPLAFPLGTPQHLKKMFINLYNSKRMT
jgi:hypothetical protein